MLTVWELMASPSFCLSSVTHYRHVGLLSVVLLESHGFCWGGFGLEEKSFGSEFPPWLMVLIIGLLVICVLMLLFHISVETVSGDLEYGLCLCGFNKWLVLFEGCFPFLGLMGSGLLGNVWCHVVVRWLEQNSVSNVVVNFVVLGSGQTNCGLILLVLVLFFSFV